MAGRPTVRHSDLDDRIIGLLQEGKSFRWFDSEEAVGLPSTATIRRWRADDAEFDARCVRACEAAADADYDEMERIERQVLGLDLAPGEKPLDPKAANVVLSNMRWRMEKRKPRTYGQKVEVKAQVTLEQLVAESLGGTGTAGGGH
ncbi:hypothetical protein [Xanthomonas phage Olaya]|nr:hypothetical protein [Xanthomonas phage Olaya]QTZ82438.1 hypothetical protein [Xanthomonas phage Bolivar]QTZ82517.1 hypothetical protein [Xanthomonas phage Usaquen]QTZ82552.1 hypothetical protein [Xanthomonas phage Alcala]QTZ82605.1 hypothetical protein [Xanthomonas phage Fontebon]QTZ82703.1 hypothetical protein [Xanthomonas phage Soumapaz]CAA2366851.1 hypothetical protein [Xylella phage Usme]